jgi:hypothetical protein
MKVGTTVNDHETSPKTVSAATLQAATSTKRAARGIAPGKSASGGEHNDSVGASKWEMSGIMENPGSNETLNIYTLSLA